MPYCEPLAHPLFKKAEFKQLAIQLRLTSGVKIRKNKLGAKFQLWVTPGSDSKIKEGERNLIEFGKELGLNLQLSKMR